MKFLSTILIGGVILSSVCICAEERPNGDRPLEEKDRAVALDRKRGLCPRPIVYLMQEGQRSYIAESREALSARIREMVEKNLQFYMENGFNTLSVIKQRKILDAIKTQVMTELNFEKTILVEEKNEEFSRFLRAQIYAAAQAVTNLQEGVDYLQEEVHQGNQGINERIDGLEQEVHQENQGIQGINERLDDLEQEITQGIQGINTRINTLQTIINGLSGKNLTNTIAINVLKSLTVLASIVLTIRWWGLLSFKTYFTNTAVIVACFYHEKVLKIVKNCAPIIRYLIPFWNIGIAEAAAEDPLDV
ncbi:MAG: hypothetical protein LBS83_00545 [Holosporales bacterium]|nr:hypothetical protein [Holosporales bacterium]